MKKIINLVVGVGVVFVAIQAIQRQMEIRDWPSSVAQVVDVDIEEGWEWETKKTVNGEKKRYREKEYYLLVNYAYEVDGRRYVDNYQALEGDYRSYVEDRMDRFPKGKELTIKYDPENPSDSVVR